MERYIRKIQALCSIGDELANLSTCKRLQVGAIIFPCDCSSIYSIGYNGPPCGISNAACTEKEGDCGCVHAETNAVIKFHHYNAKPSLLFSTRLPCPRCIGHILNCRSIVGVIWDKVYRDSKGLDLLKAASIAIAQFNELEGLPITLDCWKNAIS